MASGTPKNSVQTGSALLLGCAQTAWAPTEARAAARVMGAMERAPAEAVAEAEELAEAHEATAAEEVAPVEEVVEAQEAAAVEEVALAEDVAEAVDAAPPVADIAVSDRGSLIGTLALVRPGGAGSSHPPRPSQ
ncbi:MAG: hypothetical protein IPJ65_10940 [Archangiaceae bacterium]|nr:hypothetical protein [Archangiaceae bacterium]